MDIPAYKDLQKYRKAELDEQREADKADMEFEFELQFREAVLNDADSFHFIFKTAWNSFKQELCDTVKSLGYTALLVQDAYYGEVLHIQFR